MNFIPPQDEGRLRAAASGVLPNGKPVVVNSDGTVSVTASTSNSQIVGADEVFESATIAFTCSTFDSNSNKVVIAYRDAGNSNYGTAVVGTVASDDITFGTPVVFENATVGNMGPNAITFDSNSNKVVINYSDAGNSDYGTSIVGTVSGTSISFGTAVVFSSSATYEIGSTFDSTNNKVVICYGNGGDGAQGYAIVGTVSGTGISFGSAAEYESGESKYNSAAFDTVNGKVVIAYVDDNDGDDGKAVVATVSGTSISFGSIAAFNTEAGDANTSYVGIAYDSSSGKMLVAFRDGGDGFRGNAVVGTISGTSISFGSEAEFEAGDTDHISVAAFSASSQVAVFYRDKDDSNKGKVNMGTISGTSVSFAGAVDVTAGTISYTTAVNDTNANQLVFAYKDDANSNYGTANVFQPAYTSTNLTAENYIGMSGGGVSATSFSKGSAAVFESAESNFMTATFDTNSNKVVIAYKDGGNSAYGTAVVGTVSGASISFGTPVVFESANSQSIGITFDSNLNKVVIAYVDAGNSSYGTAIVGTVSGTSISFGSAAVYESASTEYHAPVFDSSNNKVVIAYKGDSVGKVIVGTVSGTSISFGSATTFNNANTTYVSTAFDSTNNKVVIAYSDAGNSSYGTAVVATVSGTSVSVGSEVVFKAAQADFEAAVFDSSSGKVVIAYKLSSGTGSVVGTVSGTSISFGSEVAFTASNVVDVSATFDTSLNAVVITYKNSSSSNVGETTTGTVSGTSISYSGGNNALTTSHSIEGAVVYDTNSNKTVYVYNDAGNSNYGTGVVFTAGFENRGQVASGSSATVDIIGTVSENQSGLTAGQSYYVQTDGTIGLTAGSPSVFAGTAISATKLLVKT